jgi:hypothetical protein
MDEESSAIYEPLRAMGWIGLAPADRELAWKPGTAIPGDWYDVVIRHPLACGIQITVERRGFAVYDFAGWLPGVAHPHGVPIRKFGQMSEAAKPALVSRLRVINSHLALLHSAAMFRHNESPFVTRVHSTDLYRFDYPDVGGEGFWYRPLEDVLPNMVTVADRARFGVMPTETFELSLKWLDAVVGSGSLVEFDLLNAAQSATATHDYALAVVAGWTVCELRVRALGSRTPGGMVREVSKVCAALRQHGVLSEILTTRLSNLRVNRNKWLHSGIEPSEAAALEAVRLATELLRSVVPDLTITTARGLLIL